MFGSSWREPIRLNYLHVSDRLSSAPAAADIQPPATIETEKTTHPSAKQKKKKKKVQCEVCVCVYWGQGCKVTIATKSREKRPEINPVIPSDNPLLSSLSNLPQKWQKSSSVSQTVGHKSDPHHTGNGWSRRVIMFWSLFWRFISWFARTPSYPKKEEKIQNIPGSFYGSLDCFRNHDGWTHKRNLTDTHSTCWQRHWQTMVWIPKAF